MVKLRELVICYYFNVSICNVPFVVFQLDFFVKTIRIYKYYVQFKIVVILTNPLFCGLCCNYA